MLLYDFLLLLIFSYIILPFCTKLKSLYVLHELWLLQPKMQQITVFWSFCSISVIIISLVCKVKKCIWDKQPLFTYTPLWATCHGSNSQQFTRYNIQLIITLLLLHTNHSNQSIYCYKRTFKQLLPSTFSVYEALSLSSTAADTGSTSATLPRISFSPASVSDSSLADSPLTEHFKLHSLYDKKFFHHKQETHLPT